MVMIIDGIMGIYWEIYFANLMWQFVDGNDSNDAGWRWLMLMANMMHEKTVSSGCPKL
jgi:hypothetical protein